MKTHFNYVFIHIKRLLSDICAFEEMHRQIVPDFLYQTL